MTSFIDRLRNRIGNTDTTFAGPGLGTTEAPPERIRNVVRTNRWDDRSWKSARKIEMIDDLVEDLVNGDEHKGGERKEYENAPELSQAVFQTFYKANPRLTPKRELDRDLYPVRKIVEEMQQNPRLKELQDMTMGDVTTSAIALDAMGDEMRQIISRLQEVPPPPEPGEQGQGGGQGQPGQPGQPGEGQPGDGHGQEQGQGQGQPGGSDSGAEQGDGSEQDDDLTDGAETDEFDPTAEDAEAQAEADWEAAYDEALSDVDFERLANKMLDAAQKEVEDLDNIRKGIGMEDGDWQQMSPEERLKLAKRLQTPQMKQLADVIGQMKRYALGIKATRVTDVPHEAYDVETGNDLRRVLRPQLALLATKETSYEFYRRFVERELLVYKMRGSEEVGKGPIVVAIDKSGSMSGGPFAWAMGVAEALRRFAADEDRDYYAMFFGSNHDRNRFDFPKGRGPFEKVLSFLSVAANGGTQFDGVLTEALEKASMAFDATGKTKADIVFITDGMASLSDDWIQAFNAERARTGVRLYSVYIGGAHDSYWTAETGPLGLLNRISDGVISVKDLRPESAKAIFAAV